MSIPGILTHAQKDEDMMGGTFGEICGGGKTLEDMLHKQPRKPFPARGHQGRMWPPGHHQRSRSSDIPTTKWIGAGAPPSLPPIPMLASPAPKLLGLNWPAVIVGRPSVLD